MGLLFGQERRQFAPEPIVPPFPGWSGYGSDTAVHSKEQALANSTVFSCVGMIANSVSLMALKTYSGTGDTPKRVADPPLVTSPSPGVTQSDFLHQTVVSLLLRGNMYAHITEFDSRMRAKQCEMLDPDTVQPRINRDTGQIEYWCRGSEIPRSEVWHIRGMTLPGGKVGMSAIAYGALAMGVELSAAKFARDFFDGGGIPKAVLQSDMPIDQTQARTLKERLAAATRNREPIALGSGVKYTPISVRPDESQFIATMQNAVSTVARFFFMPPEMVGGSTGAGSLTYANREQRAIDYLTFAVSPWLKRLEDAFFPMLPAPQYVSFDESNLLRTDAETQAKVRVQYIAGKVLPPSRVLKEMNEPPLTQDEKIELELVPLSVTATGMPRTQIGAAPNVDPGQTVEPVPAPNTPPPPTKG